MIRRPPRSTLFPTRRSSDLPWRPQNRQPRTSRCFSEKKWKDCPSARRPCRGCCRCSLRSEEHTSELQSHSDLVCRLLLEKKKKKKKQNSNKRDKDHQDDMST